MELVEGLFAYSTQEASRAQATFSPESRRFELHRKAIKWPEEKFVFDGFNLPMDLEAALKGEKRNAIDPFTEYPYGTEGKLKEKRIERNPFHRQHGYSISCPELKELLDYHGKEIFRGSLPWTK